MQTFPANRRTGKYVGRVRGWLYLLLPILFVGIATALALPPPHILAGILVMTVPAASNGFVVARAMGGDAELYADILVWQTILSIIAIPIYLGFVP